MGVGGDRTGQITKQFLVKQQPTESADYVAVSTAISDDDESGGGSGSEKLPSDSSTTFLLFLSVFVASCGTFSYGCVVGYSAPSEYEIKAELDLSVAEYSVFGSISTIGSMVGAVASGKMTDFIGRRRTLLAANMLFLMGWLGIASAQGACLLDLGRLSTGLGVGIVCYAVPVYITEISPKNLRGALASAVPLLLNCGASFMFFIGAFVTWRTLALVGVVVCLIQLLGLMLTPESPRWLAKIGREKELEATLQRLRGQNVDISQEAAVIREYTEAFEHVLKEAGILDLFQWRYAYSLTVGVGLVALQQLGGVFAVSTFASHIFVTAGFSRTVGIIAIGILQICMALLSVPLLDKIGRRPLLMISSAGMCLGSLLVALSFFLEDHQLLEKLAPILVLIGLISYKGFFAVGMAGVPWIVMSEIFPINMKGAAGSLVTLIHWFGSWLVTYSFNFVLGWSSAGTFFIFSVICGSTFLFTTLMVPETKGRTLEEIQASMTHLYN